MADVAESLELHITKVSEILVIKGISSDNDSAKRYLQKYFGTKKTLISCQDFNKLFCKCIFKDALINLAAQIEALSSKKEVPMALKLGEF